MGINKIKLKQIDANFSGLVGEYGSGYFPSISTFDNLSGITVKYSDINPNRFVLPTGNQTISGIKTFIDVPRVGGGAGSGVLYSGQINPVYVTGVISNVDTYPIFVQGTSSEFKNLQMESGFSYNPSTKILKCNIFSGNLSGFASNSINSSGVFTSGNTNLNAQMYPTFAVATGSGFQILNVNSNLSYNPNSGILTSQTFFGNLSGNAASATNAAGVSLTSDNSVGTYFVPFSKTTGVSGNALFIDNSTTTLNYNPATSTLTASTFRGSVNGNALNAFSMGATNIGTFGAGDSINFNFPAGTSAYIMTSGAFYATPAVTTNTTARNLGLATNGWNNLYVGVAPILTSDRNLKTEISEIPDSWLDAWQEVDYVKYKFKDAVNSKGADNARWHIGHIAQNIYDAFDKHGINAFDIGMLCYDSWGESVDQNGNVTPSGEIWSIRPDECQFMELALMRRSINRLRSGILI